MHVMLGVELLEKVRIGRKSGEGGGGGEGTKRDIMAGLKVQREEDKESSHIVCINITHSLHVLITFINVTTQWQHPW